MNYQAKSYKNYLKPAVEPINTNAQLGRMEVKFNISSKRTQSTLDRVMGKLNKL